MKDALADMYHKPVMITGQNFGGLIAALAAAQSPQNVENTILINPTIAPENHVGIRTTLDMLAAPFRRLAASVHPPAPGTSQALTRGFDVYQVNRAMVEARKTFPDLQTHVSWVRSEHEPTATQAQVRKLLAPLPGNQRLFVQIPGARHVLSPNQLETALLRARNA